MTVRMAFAGFRHGHILGLYDLARGRDDVRVVAACEEHGPTREALTRAGRVEFTHSAYEGMWEEDFEVLAIGDYYGRRGELAIRALQSGRHVIADKPLCTSLEELDRIAELSTAKGRCVGCMLTMRDSGNARAMRQLVLAGRIGEVHTIDFQGQHPLLPGKRPEWYFQPGKQGGTINDLAIHAVDLIGWMTGRRIVEIVAARAWNARAKPEWFQDGAQLMLRLDNDGGVLGDVSYLTPEAHAYRLELYWRFTLHGSEGLAEMCHTVKGVKLYAARSEAVEHLPPAEERTGGYFEDFLSELAGRDLPAGGLTTEQVLTATRQTLQIQKAADENLHGVPCM